MFYFRFHERENEAKRGKTRLRPANRQGAWSDMEQSVNALIDDLILPIETMTEAMASVAKGDLTRTVPLESDGRPLQGEFLRAATIVNRMLGQMTEQHVAIMLAKSPMGRFAEADEIAAMVAWMASEDCSFTTGATFDCSGGRAVY